MSTVSFDYKAEIFHDRIKEKTDKDYTVNGYTDLMDAIGCAIHHIGNIHKYAMTHDVCYHNRWYGIIVFAILERRLSI